MTRFEEVAERWRRWAKPRPRLNALVARVHDFETPTESITLPPAEYDAVAVELADREEAFREAMGPNAPPPPKGPTVMVIWGRFGSTQVLRGTTPMQSETRVDSKPGGQTMAWAQEQSIASDEARRRAFDAAEMRRRRDTLALDMRAQGHTKEEIAERLGIPESTVTHILRRRSRREG